MGGASSLATVGRPLIAIESEVIKTAAQSASRNVWLPRTIR
jgi:hypothetical protein